jgi:COP9 signalosome complex subunit 7
MASSEDLTDGTSLQPFVLLAKSAKGKACAAVILQALNASGVYVFGELLEMENVKQLRETEDKPVFDLLKIFAYGTYGDYKASNHLPPLNPQLLKKLRQLTIVSLSASNKVIPYSTLLLQLEIGELRELEDLIIDAIYQGLISAQLDQRYKQLEIRSSMGRDLKPEALDDMIEVLSNWTSQAENLLITIKDKVDHVSLMSEQERLHQEKFEKKVEANKLALHSLIDMDAMQADYDGELGIYGQHRFPYKDHVKFKKSTRDQSSSSLLQQPPNKKGMQ